MRTIIAILLLSISIKSFASEEDYFGSYSSINTGLKISFFLNEEGVKELKVDGIAYDTTTLTYDYLGVFGNSQIFQINFVDKNKFEHVIKLFIVTNEGEFVIATGFYMQYSLNDKNKLIINKKQSIEFKFTKQKS
ncbi:MAG: hypothetical protein LWX56_14705 [Ignavibacteria bacterium]|nr:hypothetical protein [Ignavibacteria bacterium]